MTSKALRRRVVQMVCNPRYRQARILEKTCCPYQPGEREIAFGRWQLRPKESAHQRAGENIQLPRQLTNRRNPWRCIEQKLEKPPAIFGYSGKVETDLCKR